MSLSIPVTTSCSFDEKLSENARMFLIGVRNYDDARQSPVASAHNNVVSWLIQGLRMGISPHGNHVHIDANAYEVQRIADEVLVVADLESGVRRYARIQIAGWTPETRATCATGEARWDDWGLTTPTFGTILSNLIDHANHIQSGADRRLLMVFSGHGALSGGSFVLCPQDTMPLTEAPDLQLETRRARLSADHPQHASTLDALFRLAERRGVSAELLDVLEASGIPFQAGLTLTLQAIEANLRRLPVSLRERPAPSYLNVITPVHLLLVLGGVDERVTIVLDACHSGGFGDALQGSTSAHDWTRLGLVSPILSASQKAQQAAEATLGDRRYSAATWALTRVLSRWGPVADGAAYAMGISNGNLVLRANMMLDALSFNQQISLSAPERRPSSRRRRAADLPFFGMHASTQTTVDPNADADGIQLSAGGSEVRGWYPSQYSVLSPEGVTTIHDDLNLMFLAVGVNRQSDWTYGGRTYARGKLYVFADASTIGKLSAGNSSSGTMTFDLVSIGDGDANWGNVTSYIDNHITAPGIVPVEMNASGDTAEHGYVTQPALPNRTFGFTKAGGREVVLVFVPAMTSPARGASLRLLMQSPTGSNPFPFTPTDFTSTSRFVLRGAVPLTPAPPNANCSWERIVDIT